ncbi:MAG: hypothetical protein KAZ03_03965 [Thiopseudomonas sp.]|nr:hypothetical protein [Thiopseudomonas sp.]
MVIIAILVCIAAFLLGWLYSIKTLATLEPLLRHFISLLVGAVTLFMAIAILIFFGVIAPQGKNPAADDVQKDPSAALFESVVPFQSEPKP